jgi:glycosyltransferase involved in cell wall biosynthesis
LRTRKYPKISVVTPSYNAAHLIEQTLRSVLDQGYPNLEYVVIDGAGGDRTKDILTGYSDRLAYWCSEPDDGQYDAINKGFARSSGEVLCWLNSDDMLLPRSLFVVGEIFEKFPEVDWITTRRPGLWDANGYLAGLTLTPGFNRQAFMDGLFLPGTLNKGYWIQQESTFWRRSLWVRAGGEIPDVRLAGDFALWCQFYRHTQLVAVDYPLGGFRLIEGQRSEDMLDYMTEARAALSAARNFLGWVPDEKFTLRYQTPNAGATFDTYRSAACYQGAVIYNPTPKVSGDNWQLQQHQFLP